MNLSARNIFLRLFCIVLLFTSCEKKWDEHNQVDDSRLSENLLEQIGKSPELSMFYDYLKQTGFDAVLKSSKTFTVWAPTNDALAAIDPGTINTEEKLKLFIGNHISNQAYLTTQVSGPFVRIKTLSGKNVLFSANAVDGFELRSSNVYTANGVLHTIASPLVPKPSVWQYLMSTNTAQKTALNAFNYVFFDKNKAEEIGVNQKTGLPIYKEGTGIVNANRFLNGVANINNEDSLYTYVILTDEAFKAEQDKLNKYYEVSVKDSTDSIVRFNVVKDLAFRGILDANNLPGTVYSINDSVKFHLNKGAIKEIRNVSNGVVFVMNSINYDLTGNGSYDPYTKIKPIKIEGEDANAAFLSVKTNTKPLREDPSGKFFTQLSVVNHATNSYWARYLPSVVNKTKYKVYWRVVRDYNLVIPAAVPPAVQATDLVYSPMRVAFKTTAVTPAFPYVAKPGAVPLKNSTGQPILDANGRQAFGPDYDLRELGEYTAERYYSGTLKSGPAGRLPVYLVGNTTTANGTNDLLLDYILMVPLP